MTDLFWWIACSDWALGFDLLLLLVALVVGHLPFAGKIPVIAPYVVAARFTAYLILAVMMLCIGHRIADESATINQLKNDLAFADDQLTWQKRAADDAEKLRADAESKADAANQKVADYAAELAKLPADSTCTLTDDDLRRLRDIAH